MSMSDQVQNEHEEHAGGLDRLIAFLSTWSLFIVAAIWAAFIVATL